LSKATAEVEAEVAEAIHSLLQNKKKEKTKNKKEKYKEKQKSNARGLDFFISHPKPPSHPPPPKN